MQFANNLKLRPALINIIIHYPPLNGNVGWSFEKAKDLDQISSDVMISAL